MDAIISFFHNCVLQTSSLLHLIVVNVEAPVLIKEISVTFWKICLFAFLLRVR